MSNSVKNVSTMNNSNCTNTPNIATNVFVTDRVKRVNTELHLKLDNLFNATQKLFSNLYDEVENVNNEKVKLSILETIWQIQTLIEVQKENLTYEDFLAVEELVFHLTQKTA